MGDCVQNCLESDKGMLSEKEIMASVTHPQSLSANDDNNDDDRKDSSTSLKLSKAYFYADQLFHFTDKQGELFEPFCEHMRELQCVITHSQHMMGKQTKII